MGTPEPPPVPPKEAADVREVLRRFGFELQGSPSGVADSVSNANFRAETATGTLFVRAHKKTRTRERVEREREAIEWVGERGIPVIRPLIGPDGEQAISVSGRLWTVYPWLTGRTLQRGKITTAEANMLGALQGRLQRILAEHSVTEMPINSELTWDTEQSLSDLSRGDDLIRYYPSPGEWLIQVQEWIRAQMELLESDEPKPSTDFTSLALQATHGDYHERNVMLDESGGLLAVVDWERFCLNPPVFEVIRALQFMKLFEPALTSAYLAGYASENRFEAASIEPAVEAWWQSSFHNTWAFRDRFIGGNAAVEQFFKEGADAIAQLRQPEFRAWLADALRAAAI